MASINTLFEEESKSNGSLDSVIPILSLGKIKSNPYFCFTDTTFNATNPSS